MKKAIAIALFAASMAAAGPLKVATFPLVHPKKTAHGGKKVVKGVSKASFKVGKALLW